MGGLEMNKTELVEAVVAKAGISKKDADAVVKATFEAITEAMAKGDKVALVGFGNFEVRERAARKGKNPSNGQVIDIPACKAPAFKPGKALRDTVNN